jgi:hypothetical protein
MTDLAVRINPAIVDFAKRGRGAHHGAARLVPLIIM